MRIGDWGKCLALALCACAARPTPKPPEDPCAYFPPGELDKSYSCWFGDCLRALDEPGYHALESGPPAYRFTWLRSEHRVISVRVEKANDGARVFGKRLAGADCSAEREDPRTFELRDDSWNRLETHFADGEFWTAEPPAPISNGKDGAQWVFEGWNGDRYRVLRFWSDDMAPPEDIGRPAPSPAHRALRSVALEMLELAGMKPRSADEIY